MDKQTQQNKICSVILPVYNSERYLNRSSEVSASYKSQRKRQRPLTTQRKIALFSK